LNIIIGSEDNGIEIGALIKRRAPGAVYKGCLINADNIGSGRAANVVITGCADSSDAELPILCGVLADIIVENLQVRHMVRLLKRDYEFLPEKEQCDILVRVLSALWYPGNTDKTGSGAGVAACKSDVRRRLLRALQENDAQSVMLEGFMRFRMKDYLKAWEQKLHACAAAHIRKREYAEFVEILRLFVGIRIPRARTVHICVDGRGKYVMLDEKLCLIAHAPGSGAEKEDALLTSLVNIAPQHIVIHNAERFNDARILETIKDVFGKRVSFSEDMI